MISSLFLLRFLSHFSLYYLPLIQLTSISVIIRNMLTVEMMNPLFPCDHGVANKPQNFRSMSMELSLQGAKVLRSESSCYR